MKNYLYMYYKVDIFIAHSNPLLYKLNILDICKIHINFQITSLLIYSQISYIIYMYMYCIFILNKARQLRFSSFHVFRDHRTVFVGEDKGRVYNWTVTDQPGRVVADHWIKDDGVEKCHSCAIRFSFSERKHHCRNCGKVFCSK